MKVKLSLGLAVFWFLIAPSNVHATVVFQSIGSPSLAFEADTMADALIPGTPESWGSVPDPKAAGGTALRANGVNNTANAPHSFAHYRLQFSSPGIYFIYYRWRADETLTGADPFTANSSFIGSQFGKFSNPGEAGPFTRTDSNAAQAPADNVYVWHQEPTLTYLVDPSNLGVPQDLTLGTREAGMFLDRFVISTISGLTEAQLDATADSLTDTISQGAQEAFVSFEAERPGVLVTPGTPESWVPAVDSTASGGAALKADGVNNTATAPHSFAQYFIQFASAGTYYIYYRWRADEKLTGADPFTANSAFIGSQFGSFVTPGNASAFTRTDSNAAQAPADNTYTWHQEPTLTYVVEESAVGTVLTLTLGTREAGMYFDRFVFSTTAGLTDSQLDALPNTGVPAVGPKLSRAVGSATLNTVALTFSKPLSVDSVQATDFHSDNGLSILNATVDPEDARRVLLDSSAQTQGTRYTITVSGVNDLDGNAIAANSTAAFTAWTFAAGWVTKEIYYFAGAPNTSLDSLKSLPIYPNRPSTVQWVKGFQSNNEPLTDNYGLRMTAVFQPAATDSYTFYVTDDDQAELSLSTDASEGNLAVLQSFNLTAPPFTEASSVSSGDVLESGKGYLLRALLRQGGGNAYLNIAAKASNDPTTADQLNPLANSQIGTFVNPDLGQVTFDKSPENQTAQTGQRARFSVKVQSEESPIYYQWKRNGKEIPGATRPEYVTPVLSLADDGGSYQVVVSVAGKATISTAATLAVSAGPAREVEPYLGVNFVGGGGGGLPGSLSPQDVTGAIAQDHWNNLTGFTFDALNPTTVLMDASGNDTPVTLGANASETFFTGTIDLGTADAVLLQGHIDKLNSTDPLVITLNSVPEDTYHVLVYSVGFQFQATYEQAVELAGAENYTTYHVRAQASLDYQKDPQFKRMSSVNPDARELGNYVQFDNVHPDSTGTFTLSLTPESATPGNNHLPPVSAVQLVRVLPVPQGPRLSINLLASQVEVSWTADAAGYVLESASSILSGAVWTAVQPPPNGILVAGSVKVALPASGNQFFRLRKAN